MFYQILFSSQVKRCTIISYKHGIYELPHKLPSDLALPELGFFENIRGINRLAVENVCTFYMKFCTYTVLAIWNKSWWKNWQMSFFSSFDDVIMKVMCWHFLSFLVIDVWKNMLYLRKCLYILHETLYIYCIGNME